MIVDARTLPPGHQLATGVCIVGAGAAGIALARTLAMQGVAVALLDSGGLDPVAGEDARNQGDLNDARRHPPLTLYRARCLGGSTALWGGRCVPFDAIDFEPRPHVPHSGWPFRRAELEPFYPQATRLLDAGDFRFEVGSALPGRPAEMIPGFDDPLVRTSMLERFSHPTNLGRRFAADLQEAANVLVVLHATCLQVQLNPEGTAVLHLDCASLPGRGFQVRAEDYVLAAGGLETTRLLLASDDVQPHGVGNGRGLVGRFYQCHVEGKGARLRLRPGTPSMVWDYERDAEGVYCRRRFWITEEEQRRRGLMNFIARVEPPTMADPSHRSAVLSAFFLSGILLRPEYARKLASLGPGQDDRLQDARFWMGHLRNLVRDAPAFLRFMRQWRADRRPERKRPTIVNPAESRLYDLDYFAEQAPNPDSRVGLALARDEHGRRRLQVDWRITPADLDSVVESYRLIQARLETAGVADLEIDEDLIRRGYAATGGHHLGTTRMAEDASGGVVDGHGRVFGVPNLLICSGSVFPTSSHANPTLTLVALALRMGRHLADQRRNRQPILVTLTPPQVRPIVVENRRTGASPFRFK